MYHTFFDGVNTTIDTKGRTIAEIITPLYQNEYHTAETEGNLVGHVPIVEDRVIHNPNAHPYGKRLHEVEGYHIIETLRRMEPNTNRNLVDYRKMIADNHLEFVSTIRRNAADEWYTEGLYELPEHTIHGAIRRTNHHGHNMFYIYGAEKELILEEIPLYDTTKIYNTLNSYGLLFKLKNRTF